MPGTSDLKKRSAACRNIHEFPCQEYFQVDAPDKFHNGWLVTGDVAKIDEEGAVVICDRSKDVVLPELTGLKRFLSRCCIFGALSHREHVQGCEIRR